MLLREFRDNLQNLTRRKITNEYLGSLFGTSSQNISKRIKNDSEVTVSEVEIAQADCGVVILSRSDDKNLNIISNTLERQNDTTIPQKVERFGHRLSELQDKHEYLDKDMAKLLRISEEEYIDLKCGDIELEFSMLVRLKQCFKVSIDWLLFGE